MYIRIDGNKVIESTASAAQDGPDWYHVEDTPTGSIYNYTYDPDTELFEIRTTVKEPTEDNNSVVWDYLPEGTYVDVYDTEDKILLATVRPDSEGSLEFNLEEAGDYTIEVYPSSPFLPVTKRKIVT